MVARILSGDNMRGLVLYNENKVAAGEASLILASRFGTELDRLDLRSKLNRFLHLTSLRPSVDTNTIHIILSFDQSDDPSISGFQKIASRYMDGIGFGEQPYLVYNHGDTVNPHLHIVTTNINSRGERMDIHGIGYKYSEPIRKELETEFGLVKAQGRGHSEAPEISPITIENAIYGKKPTKRAINNVVSAVMRGYRFTSMAEYNAILCQFNVMADRGREDTVMFEKRGLIYSIIDEKGNRVGVPFKASLLTGRPTLDKVEKKFARNSEIRKTYKDNIKSRIDKVLGKYDQLTQKTFIGELHKQQIALVLRRNDKGQIYGATFVDHSTKCVFNGSDLGKGYSAKELTARFAQSDVPRTYLQKTGTTDYLKTAWQEQGHQGENLLEIALQQGGLDPIPVKRKKRKKGKGQQQGLGL